MSSLCCHEPNDGRMAKLNHTPSMKQGNRAVTDATDTYEGGTSTPGCKLDQGAHKTTCGAREAERTKTGTTTEKGRQHGKQQSPHKHSEERKN